MASQAAGRHDQEVEAQAGQIPANRERSLKEPKRRYASLPNSGKSLELVMLGSLAFEL